MTTPSPSAGDVAKLVEELRALSAYPGDAYDRAADALEDQGHELAETRDALDFADQNRTFQIGRVESLSRDLAEARAALVQCRSALAMMIAPNAIENTTVINAFAAAVAAEARARSVLPQKEAAR